MKARALEDVRNAVEDVNSIANRLGIFRDTGRIEIPVATASPMCANLQKNITGSQWVGGKVVCKLVLSGILGLGFLTCAERSSRL